VFILKSEEAFKTLYASESRGVQRFLEGMVGGRQVAEELTQDAFLKAWKSLPSFALKSSLKTWVYSVAINTARDWLRGHVHRATLELKDEHTAEGELQSPETRAVREALNELNEEIRALLMLHYYEDLDLKEIATILEIPVGTVKSRLFAAKGKLRPLLLAKGFDV
jgi:RNA polymerase sigma-70 factor (ECF subfamily)